MTAERLTRYRDEWCKDFWLHAQRERGLELFAHIDALSARVAELERERDDWRKAARDNLDTALKHDAIAQKAQSELAAARKGWRMLKIVGRQMDLDHGSHHAHVVDWPADWPLLVPAEYEIRALQTKDTTP